MAAFRNRFLRLSTVGDVAVSTVDLPDGRFETTLFPGDDGNDARVVESYGSEPDAADGHEWWVRISRVKLELSDLDGSTWGAVSLLTGLSDADLAELGGFQIEIGN